MKILYPTVTVRVSHPEKKQNIIIIMVKIHSFVNIQRQKGEYHSTAIHHSLFLHSRTHTTYNTYKTVVGGERSEREQNNYEMQAIF